MKKILCQIEFLDSRRAFIQRLFRYACLSQKDTKTTKKSWAPQQYVYYLVQLEHHMLQNIRTSLDFCDHCPKPSLQRWWKHKLRLTKIRLGILPKLFPEIVSPPPLTSPEAALAQWKNIRAKTWDYLEDLPDYAAGCTVLFHPKYGQITLQEWVDLLSAHVRLVEDKLVAITHRKEKRLKNLPNNKPLLFYKDIS